MVVVVVVVVVVFNSIQVQPENQLGRGHLCLALLRGETSSYATSPQSSSTSSSLDPSLSLKKTIPT